MWPDQIAGGYFEHSANSDPEQRSNNYLGIANRRSISKSS